MNACLSTCLWTMESWGPTVHMTTKENLGIVIYIYLKEHIQGFNSLYYITSGT